MALSPQNAAIALVSRPNGTLIEILYDELGVSPRISPGNDFTD